MRAALATAFACSALIAPATAAADDRPENDEGDQARDRLECAGARLELRLRPEEEDDEAWIRIELRADTTRRRQTWRVVVLHERVLVFQGRRASIRAAGFDFRLNMLVPDWAGEESVTARLSAPSGRTCVLGATI